MVPTSSDLKLFAKDTKFAIEQKQKEYFNFGSCLTFAGKTLEEGKIFKLLNCVFLGKKDIMNLIYSCLCYERPLSNIFFLFRYFTRNS